MNMIKNSTIVRVYKYNSESWSEGIKEEDFLYEGIFVDWGMVGRGAKGIDQGIIVAKEVQNGYQLECVLFSRVIVKETGFQGLSVVPNNKAA